MNSAIARAFEARERAVAGARGRDGRAQHPVGRRHRAPHAPPAVGLPAHGGHRGGRRPARQRLAAPAGALDERLSALEGQLSRLTNEVSNLASALDASPSPPPREQERLKVDEARLDAGAPARQHQEEGVSDYTVLRAADAPDYTGEHPGAFLGYARPMESEQLAVNVRVLEPGMAHMPPGGDPTRGHSHRTIEEIYFVLDGELTIKLGDDVLDARPARRGADPRRDAPRHAERLGLARSRS